jgi:hypothetical protein
VQKRTHEKVLYSRAATQYLQPSWPYTLADELALPEVLLLASCCQEGVELIGRRGGQSIGRGVRKRDARPNRTIRLAISGLPRDAGGS